MIRLVAAAAAAATVAAIGYVSTALWVVYTQPAPVE